MSEIDVGETLDELCDHEIKVNRNSLGYYLNNVADLASDHRAELTAQLPSKDVSPFLRALNGLLV